MSSSHESTAFSMHVDGVRDMALKMNRNRNLSGHQHRGEQKENTPALCNVLCMPESLTKNVGSTCESCRQPSNVILVSYSCRMRAQNSTAHTTTANHIERPLFPQEQH
jgi:hypothetical protein